VGYFLTPLRGLIREFEPLAIVEKAAEQRAVVAQSVSYGCDGPNCIKAPARAKVPLNVHGKA
jgi:hypothetical protein